jgi:hypothetical protein
MFEARVLAATIHSVSSPFNIDAHYSSARFGLVFAIVV